MWYTQCGRPGENVRREAAPGWWSRGEIVRGVVSRCSQVEHARCQAVSKPVSFIESHGFESHRRDHENRFRAAA